ncbi:peroxisomal assembly protein [Schaereria dolodes]|nr:peroxisomal assembly protein [Schaereria dolodes]
MDVPRTIGEHRKRRRRRRRQHRSPISAKLVLDDTGNGEVGSLSSDLYADIFDYDVSLDQAPEGYADIRYVAICPWSPNARNLEGNTPWTILPIKVPSSFVEKESTQLPPSALRILASAHSLQSFARVLDRTRPNLWMKNGIEILIIDVQPLVLERVIIKVDGKALQEHEKVQKRYGGGFMATQPKGYPGRRKNGAVVNGRTDQNGNCIFNTKENDVLATAVRKSLALATTIHKNDLLSLPLPAHPITHVPLPPLEISSCEPVDQGIMSGQTKIVIDIVYDGGRTNKQSVSDSNSVGLGNFTSQGEEDTSNEQWFSAVEEGSHRASTSRNGSHSCSPNSSISNMDDSSPSDDSMEDMISLSSPSLPSQPSGVSSSMTTATPRFGTQKSDGGNTPGSVFSIATTTTVREGYESGGKLFQAKPLLRPMPDYLLHPTPAADEDEEARVFVDVKMLAKMGCFSGDWVKLFASSEPLLDNGSHWGPGQFEEESATVEEFRVVKVYGVSNMLFYTNKYYTGENLRDGRSSVNALTARRPTPEAYISPLLLANIGQPTRLRLTALSVPSQRKAGTINSGIKSSSIPPIAKEVTLLRIPSPISTERSVQAGLLSRLKLYFACRRRILKHGDLIGIAFDVEISRIMSLTPNTADLEDETAEMLNSCNMGGEKTSNSTAVAWFKVGQIMRPNSNEDITSIDKEVWGGAATIEPVTTRMVQAGTELSRIPPMKSNPWAYYLGLQRLSESYPTFRSPLQSFGSSPKLLITPTQRRIRELLAATMSPRAGHFRMKPTVILLHSTQRSIGKAHLVSSACADLGLHLFSIDTFDILTEGNAGGGDVKTEAFLKARIERALSCGAEHTIPLLRHVEALTADRMALALRDLIGDMRAFVATTTTIENVPEQVRNLFTHELHISAPDEGEREVILYSVIQSKGIRLSPDVDISSTAIKTAALVAGDLVDVIDRAVVARQERLEKLSSQRNLRDPMSATRLVRDVLVSGGVEAQCIIQSDMDIAVEAARKNFADAIGAPKIPNVSWDDVGGLANVKDAVMETIQLPLERPELFAKGMKKRSGILFYGPPGTGKTLLAKAIATEFSLNFFSVKGPELLNMYIGESEANVRRVFQRARDARPCVVFFDELDSVAPKRGNQGDSGGVMDRIVSQLLAELDGMSDGDGNGGGVFVIGATNRPDLLDQALVRPGRFDKMLYLGVSDTHDKQLTILEALTRKFSMHPAMSLRRVVESLPFTYTGADLYALSSDAMLKAITRQAAAVDAKTKSLPGGPVTTAYFFDHFATSDDLAVMVREGDFLAAQRELVGSVSAKELEHYHRVRKIFEGPIPSQSDGDSAIAVSEQQASLHTGHGQKFLSRPKSKTRTSSHKSQGRSKSRQWDTDEEEEDDVYMTSNDAVSSSRHKSTNGRNKEPTQTLSGIENAFEDLTKDDNEDLYS